MRTTYTGNASAYYGLPAEDELELECDVCGAVLTDDLMCPCCGAGEPTCPGCGDSTSFGDHSQCWRIP